MELDEGSFDIVSISFMILLYSQFFSNVWSSHFGMTLGGEDSAFLWALRKDLLKLPHSEEGV